MPFGADRPATAQYEPCVHGVCIPMPALAQNDDTGQTVAAVLAAGQYVVGWQLPVGALRPDVAQYDPLEQGAKADRPAVLQNAPIGHRV